jgi:tetratricopeptide (TPR) repeat protein
MSEKLTGAPNEDSALSLVSLGRAQQYSGEAAAAESSYRRAIAFYRGTPGRYEIRLAAALLNLGKLLTTKGDFDEGVATMREGVALLEKQGETYMLSASEGYLCVAHADHGDYARAIEACGSAVEIGRKVGVEDTPDFVVSLDRLGLSLTRTGRAKEAEPVLRESLDRAKKDFQPADARTPLIEGALGECLTAQGRYAEAEPLVTHSYDALKSAQGDKSPLTALAAKRAADLYDKWNKPDLAAKYRAAAPTG